MNDLQIIRSAAIELSKPDDLDIIRVAGIRDRISNWLKSFKDPEYKKEVDNLSQQSERTQYLISELSKNLEVISKSLENTDVDQYHKSVRVVGDLARQLSAELGDLEQRTHSADVPDSVKSEYPQEPPREWTKFTREQLKDPSIRKELTGMFHENYDVPVGYRINQPMQSFRWFSQFSPEEISISQTPANNLYQALSKVMSRDLGYTPQQSIILLNNNREEFWNNVRNGILNGRLNYNSWATGGGHRRANQMQMSITTDPIVVPETDLSFSTTVIVMDLAASVVPNNILSVRSFHSIVTRPRMPGEVPVPSEQESIEDDEQIEEVDYSGYDDKADFYSESSSVINALKKLAAGRMVSKTTTPLNRQQIADALRVTYKEVFGQDPTAEMLGTAWAQVALETGNGSKIYNNNLGNITAGGNWQGDYHVLGGYAPSGTGSWRRVRNSEVTPELRQKSIEILRENHSRPFGTRIPFTASDGKRYAGLIEPHSNKPIGLSLLVYTGGNDTGKIIKGTKFRSYDTPEEGASDYWRLLGRRYSKPLQWFGTGDPLHASLALGDAGYYGGESRTNYATAVTKLFDKFMTEYAPNQPGLVSAPQPRPEGPLPEYKERKDSPVQPIPQNLVARINKYTLEGQNHSQPAQRPVVQNEIPLSEEKILRDYEDLMKVLFAHGPVESLVRKAVMRDILPTTSLLLSVNSDNASFPSMVRYARILASALREELDAEISIHHDGKNIEIECDVAGSEEAVTKAVNAVCAGITEGFKEATQKLGGLIIKANSYNGLKSKYDVLKAETSDDNFKKFALEMMR